MNNEKIGGHGVMQSFAFLANLIALKKEKGSVPRIDAFLKI